MASPAAPSVQLAAPQEAALVTRAAMAPAATVLSPIRGETPNLDRLPIAQPAASQAGLAAPAPVDLPAPTETETETQADTTAAVTQAAAVPPIPACVAELKLIAERARVSFASGSASVNGAGREMALTLAARAAACPEAHVTILGFADPSGSKAANVALSNRRAQNVLQLISANGYGTTRYTAYSHMDGHPDGEECPHFDVVDRRVEFVVTGDGAEDGAALSDLH